MSRTSSRDQLGVQIMRGNVFWQTLLQQFSLLSISNKNELDRYRISFWVVWCQRFNANVMILRTSKHIGHFICLLIFTFCKVLLTPKPWKNQTTELSFVVWPESLETPDVGSRKYFPPRNISWKHSHRLASANETGCPFWNFFWPFRALYIVI